MFYLSICLSPPLSLFPSFYLYLSHSLTPSIFCKLCLSLYLYFLSLSLPLYVHSPPSLFLSPHQSLFNRTLLLSLTHMHKLIISPSLSLSLTPLYLSPLTHLRSKSDEIFQRKWISLLFCRIPFNLMWDFDFFLKFVPDFHQNFDKQECSSLVWRYSYERFKSACFQWVYG